jgi:hypothetical protein
MMWNCAIGMPFNTEEVHTMSTNQNCNCKPSVQLYSFFEYLKLTELSKLFCYIQLFEINTHYIVYFYPINIYDLEIFMSAIVE